MQRKNGKSYVKNGKHVPNADFNKEQHATNQKSLRHPVQNVWFKQCFHVFGDFDLCMPLICLDNPDIIPGSGGHLQISYPAPGAISRYHTQLRGPSPDILPGSGGHLQISYRLRGPSPDIIPGSGGHLQISYPALGAISRYHTGSGGHLQISYPGSGGHLQIKCCPHSKKLWCDKYKQFVRCSVPEF